MAFARESFELERIEPPAWAKGVPARNVEADLDRLIKKQALQIRVALLVAKAREYLESHGLKDETRK